MYPLRHQLLLYPRRHIRKYLYSGSSGDPRAVPPRGRCLFFRLGRFGDGVRPGPVLQRFDRGEPEECRHDESADRDQYGLFSFHVFLFLSFLRSYCSVEVHFSSELRGVQQRLVHVLERLEDPAEDLCFFRGDFERHFLLDRVQEFLRSLRALEELVAHLRVHLLHELACALGDAVDTEISAF